MDTALQTAFSVHAGFLLLHLFSYVINLLILLFVLLLGGYRPCCTKIETPFYRKGALSRVAVYQTAIGGILFLTEIMAYGRVRLRNLLLLCFSSPVQELSLPRESSFSFVISTALENTRYKLCFPLRMAAFRISPSVPSWRIALITVLQARHKAAAILRREGKALPRPFLRHTRYRYTANVDPESVNISFSVSKADQRPAIGVSKYRLAMPPYPICRTEKQSV